MIENYLETLNQRFRDFDIEYRKQAYIYYLKYPDPSYKESPDKKTYVNITEKDLERMAYGELSVSIKKDEKIDSNYDLVVTDSDFIISGEKKGVYISNMKTAFEEKKELFKKYVDQQLGKYNREYLINFSYENGYFIHFPDNTNTDVKIESIQDSNASFAFKNVIIVGKNASVEITDLYKKHNKGNGVHGRNIYIFCGEGSHVKYNYVQDEGEDTVNLTYVRPVLYRDSEIRIIDVNAGANKVFYNHESEMYDSTTMKSYGVNVSRGDQEMDIWDSSVQYGKYSNCDINIKGVVLDRSSTMHRGNIDIEPEGVKSSGFYGSAILLMSENGKGNSKPALLIKNNDTKSKHSSSISSLDPEQIFYLRSRGLSEAEAKDMIINGFTGYIEDITDNEFLKATIKDILKL
ncbi:SufD family Fe-S cluster assembly protein [Ferroplasma acidiphilum]|uniref:SufD family Fe-S cluster assembly protein n=1 Tax=Ferroplasma acidiphilum TaxID=74969 RepID=UPI0028167935|nr:SufD family Fe-S cluster assembly protein [Ferroplasma acidiphilum]WMT53908.1 MAG: SufD family Fe-S cluster assembly protein [Ferroplasma acidiphilum]